MKEVYYVLGHGMIQSTEVLDHKQRFGIPIIYFGTEGEVTYASTTMLLIPYYMKIHGNLFMNKLLNILLKHGKRYIYDFRPNDSKVERDIRFLFDVNKEEMKEYPSNVLRVYYGTTITMLNTSITTFKPNETFLYSELSLNNKPKKFIRTMCETKSIPNSQYLFNETTFFNQDKLFSLENPFGIFRFDEQERTFRMKDRLTEGVRSIKEILTYIHDQSASTPIVYMVHCKEPDKKILMDFDFTHYPIEKGHTKSLNQMMSALKLATPKTRKRKSLPTERTTKKRKLETPTPTITRTRKRKDITPPTERTTKKRKLETPTPTITRTRKRKDITPPTERTTKKRKLETPTPTTTRTRKRKSDQMV